MLRRHALVFDKPNLKRRGEGLPNLAPNDEAMVFGIICELTISQLETLAGYYGGYELRDVNVVPQPPDVLGTVNMKATSCRAFVARRTARNLRPTRAVLEATRRGAEENRAPAAFLEAIANQEVTSE